MKELRPKIRCPQCGRGPNYRITPEVVEMWEGKPPDTPIGPHKCHRCGKIDVMTVDAYQRAG